MRAILPDVNVQGHVRRLLALLEDEPWREFWVSLNLATESFEHLELPQNAPDALVWHTCQQQQIVLITANRRRNTEDSLEATIRQHNTPHSLPVITLADANRLLAERAYAERAVEKLLEYLLDIERYRGAGRLYVP